MEKKKKKNNSKKEQQQKLCKYKVKICLALQKGFRNNILAFVVGGGGGGAVVDYFISHNIHKKVSTFPSIFRAFLFIFSFIFFYSTHLIWNSLIAVLWVFCFL